MRSGLFFDMLCAVQATDFVFCLFWINSWVLGRLVPAALIFVRIGVFRDNLAGSCVASYRRLWCEVVPFARFS